MKTEVADMLGVEYPIFAFSHCRDVVAAVSNAGGFGVLGAVAHTPDRLEIDLCWIKEHTNGRPFGVDLLLPQNYEGVDQGGLDRDTLRQLLPTEHQVFVDDILARYQVPELDAEQSQAVSRFGGMNVSPRGYGPLLDVAFGHDIKLIASALGAPPPDLVERAHRVGVLVAALAGTPRHAVAHKNAGVDIVVAQGTEGGGHTGEIATMVLVPQVVDAVAPTPVLAAGGIANGRQVAASMALGAQGAWCGSVWLTTEEAETPPVIKQKYLAADSKDTVRSRSITGKPARMLKTSWTEEWERPDGPGPLAMPLQPLLVAQAQARINRAAHTPGSGAEELATYFVGQVVGQMNNTRKAGQVVLEMVQEYADVASRFADEVASAT
jgi:NAD(P)H-dependent flavin oxidoreductase YrpB (nitropropane dioxygenase family)